MITPENKLYSLLGILGSSGVPWRPGELLPVDGEHIVVASREVLVLDEVCPESGGLV